MLKEKFSISSFTFFIVLCKLFKSSLEGAASATLHPLSSKYKRHSFLRKPCTPVIPAVFQGLDCSNGPKNISYKRKLSAPYSSQIASGFTTLYLDLDIFSTSLPTMYCSSPTVSPTANTLPLSVTKVASWYSSLQFLNASISNSSEAFTKETSACKGCTSLPAICPLE